MNVHNQEMIHDIEPEARRWLITGRVQGVGFRPFVFRLAQQFGLPGRVQNLAGQVSIEAEGDPSVLDAFGAALFSDVPSLARIEMILTEKIEYSRLGHFEIIPSEAVGTQVHIPPDQSLCDDCRRELLTSQDRRSDTPSSTARSADRDIP